MRLPLLLILLASCTPARKTTHPLPGWMKGKFSDDYGIHYTITDSVFEMDGAAKYRVLEWNEKHQYILTKNDSTNKTEQGLYTRIDYMNFTGMAPYTWGFCLIIYNAKDTAEALRAAPADRANPRKGCNGFPFSRMKRVE